MKKNIKTNLMLLSLLLVLMIPFVATKSEGDPKSKEFVEDYSMRGQSYRHWYKESSGEYHYSSDYLVHKTGILEGSSWITIDEYPYRFIIRLTDGSIRTFETPDDISNYISLINNNTIWAVGYETFAGVMGFYLNFADQDWGHAQYLYWPRLKNGKLTSYSQPLYAIFPHLYAKTSGTWYNQILNDRSLYGTDNDPRNNLRFFNNENEFGIYFTTNNIDIFSSNWDMVHGFKYDKTNTIYHLITQLRCNNLNFDDVGMAYEITSTPQSDGTPYQPEYFSLINETHEVKVNISQAWEAGVFLKDFYSFVSITSRNNESFRFMFDDMENAGFTQKYLNLHDQPMPDGRTRKVLRAGMYGYGSYSQGDWIEIDPVISEDQTVDSRDWRSYLATTTYYAFIENDYLSSGLWDYRNYRGMIAWDTGITEEIGTTSDALFKILNLNSIEIEEGDYHAVKLYDKGDGDEYWSETEGVADPEGAFTQEGYYTDTDFFSVYGMGEEWVSVTDDVFGLLIDAWVTHHNVDPSGSQYLPVQILEGDGMTVSGERDYCNFPESTNVTHVPYIGFTYTLPEERECDYHYFDEYQTVDAYDFYTWYDDPDYGCKSNEEDLRAGWCLYGFVAVGISWDTGITKYVCTISDAVLRLRIHTNTLEEDVEYLKFGLYDKGDLDGIWDESEACADTEGFWDQELYWSNDSFLTDTATDTFVDIDVTEPMEEWRLYHNDDPESRQFIPFIIMNGTGIEVDGGLVTFGESTSGALRPKLSFGYTAEVEPEVEEEELEEHDPIIQEPPVWFTVEFAWFIWTLLWAGAGIIVAGLVLYYFFTRLLSMIS